MPAITKSCTCCQGTGCPVFRDPFNRPDEFWPDGPATDSTGNWIGTPNGAWSISGNALKCDASGPIEREAILHGIAAPTHASIAVDIELSETGKAGIQFNLNSGGSDGIHLYVEGEAGETCGVLRLWKAGHDLSDLAQLPGDIPVPGLVAGIKHRFRLCYNPDTKVFNASVTVRDEDGADTGTYWHHAHDIDPPAAISTTLTALFAGGVPTTTLIDGPYYFDNFAVDETKARDCCPCTAADERFSDDFNRPLEFIPPTGSDSTGNWGDGYPGPVPPANGSFWEVANPGGVGKLEFIRSSIGSGPVLGHITCEGGSESGGEFTVPISVSVDVFFFRDGDEAQIMLANTGYRVSLTSGPSGVLSIKKSIDPSTLGTAVDSKSIGSVPKLTGAASHTLTLCYDGRCLQASVDLSDGRTPQPVRADVGHFTGNTLIYLVTQTTFATIFHNFSVSTAHEAAGDDYYYAPLACDNGCPCCGGCIDTTLTFPDDDDGDYGEYEDTEYDTDTIDCRLSVTGDVTSEDGTLNIGDGGTVTYLGGFSGVDGAECVADDSRAVGVSFTSPDYGASLSVAIGDLSATLTLNSDPYSEDGTLTLSTGETAEVNAPPDGAYTFGVGVLGGDFVAGLGGTLLSHSNDDNTGDTISISASGGTFKVSALRFLSCLLTSNADIFFHDIIGIDGGDLVDCGPCRATDGQLPSELIVLIDGIGDPFAEFNAAHVVGFTAFESACKWATSWRIPETGPVYTTYTITVIISDDGMGNAVIDAALFWEQTGGELGIGGEAHFRTEAVLGVDGKIDCHELTGSLPFFSQFQFSSAAGGTVVVMI